MDVQTKKGTSPRFVMLHGPPAVGKATVGNAISAINGYKLFHNHVIIEMLTPFFQFGTPAFTTLVTEFRRRMLEELSTSGGDGGIEGVIFTYVWDMTREFDCDFVRSVVSLFEDEKVFLVELRCSLDERKNRCRMEDRLERKPSLKKLERPEELLTELDSKHAFASTSMGGSSGDGAPVAVSQYPNSFEFSKYRHMCVSVENLSPEETAQFIVQELEKEGK